METLDKVVEYLTEAKKSDICDQCGKSLPDGGYKITYKGKEGPPLCRKCANDDLKFLSRLTGRR